MYEGLVGNLDNQGLAPLQEGMQLITREVVGAPLGPSPRKHGLASVGKRSTYSRGT